MRLVVVSNRVSAPDREGKIGVGGLAVALRAALRERGGIWFGWSGRVAAAPAEQPQIVQRGKVGYAVVDIAPIDRDEYYLGFANRALWPNMHYRLGLTQFSRAEFSGYMRVNRRFAVALAAILEPDDLVWVHDYHLIPFAAELRRLGITNRIGYFHHIPWPPIDVFAALPGSARPPGGAQGLRPRRRADRARRGQPRPLVRRDAGRHAGRGAADHRAADRHRHRGVPHRRPARREQFGRRRARMSELGARAAGDRRRPARLFEGHRRAAANPSSGS